MANEEQLGEEAQRDWFDEDATRLVQAWDEIERLRTSIAALFAETEEILTRLNPRIESEWQIVIGVWENKLLEAQIDMRRAKRRYNLIQAKVNSGSAVNLREVEEQLDTELREWKVQLDEAVGRYEDAVSAQERAVQITSVEAAEQKRLFRILAKRLHPDLHPDMDESTRAMFSLAQLAYRQSDLSILKSLEASTAYLESGTQPPKTIEEAQAQIDELQAQTGTLEERMSIIKEQQPYCLRAKLDDTAWVEEHVGELKREAQDCRQAEGEYLRRCEEIVGASG